MDQPSKGATRAEEAVSLNDRQFYSLAAAPAFGAYFIVFLLVGDGEILDAAASSLRNLIPLVIVSAAAQPIIARHLVRRSLKRQLLGHLLLSAAYSLLLYWLLMVLIGISRGGSFVEFAVQAFFPTPAVAWQLLQGVTLYALLACLTYLRTRPPLPSFVVAPPAQDALAKDQSPSRYFIRKGEDIHPVEISQIVSITGADDYAEVVTTAGRHLAKMTLAEFEKALEVTSFIRVHRSHIVNLDRIARAEPAGGGRMLLHMDNGEMISASRAGSRLLRDRVI
jgi:hypothetical protein